MPFPPYPVPPAPVTWTSGENLSAAILRSDIANAVELLTQPPLFIGSQTGDAASFTATHASPCLFTAAATNFPNGQVVQLSGGSLPGGFSAATAYYVVNAATNGAGTFNLATTSGGTGVNSSGTGSGSVLLSQVLTTATWGNLVVDTETNDAWNMLTAPGALAYAQFPGFYLATATWSPQYTAGTGSVSAGITAAEGPNPAVTFGGQKAPNSGSASHFPQMMCAKLVQFSSYGSPGAAGNDYAAGSAYQNSGVNVIPRVTTTRYPKIRCEWVSLLTGSTAVAVPSNDAWPEPPVTGSPMPSQIVTEAFTNKNVRDTILFLAFPPVMEAYYSAGSATLASQSSFPTTGTTVPLDTVTSTVVAADTRSAFNTSTHTWAAPVPGIYYVYGQVALSTATTSVAISAGLTVNSANYNGGSTYTIWGGAQNGYAVASNVQCAVISRRVRLNAGDTVKLAGFQNDSGANAATFSNSTAWQSRLITIWRAA